MVALSVARGMSSEMLEIHFVLHLILIWISVTNDRFNNIWKLCQISQIILLEELIPNTSFLSEITNKIGGSIIKQKENLGKNDQSKKQGASGPSKTSSWGLFWGSNQTWTQGDLHMVLSFIAKRTNDFNAQQEGLRTVMVHIG